MSGILKTATGSSSRAEKKARATRTSPADVVSPGVSYSAASDFGAHILVDHRSLGAGVKIRRLVPTPSKQAERLER